MSATPYIATQGCSLYILDDVTVPGTPAVLKIGAVKGLTSIGGSATDIDISNMDSQIKEFAKGLLDGGAPAFDIIFNTKDASHILLHTLATLGTGATKQWYFGFSDGSTPAAPPTVVSTVLTPPAGRSGVSFLGYVKQFQIDAATDSVLMGKLSLKASGGTTITVAT